MEGKMKEVFLQKFGGKKSIVNRGLKFLPSKSGKLQGLVLYVICSSW